MSLEVKPWWNENRIKWYERASKCSDFHKKLTKAIESMISKDDTILELGCGLGYCTELLYKDGFCISAYDIDASVIEEARMRSGLDIFRQGDSYKLDDNANTLLLVFFGKITKGNNFDIFSKLAKKTIIYVTGGGSLRHTSEKEVEEFLRGRRLRYEKQVQTIAFHQPLEDEIEVEEYLCSYYEGQTLEEKREKIKRLKSARYKYILENNKKIAIFKIDVEGASN